MPRTKQFSEEEVLSMAMELFWEKGFHATSINDLVSHLGINRASLYDTFGGKRPLFNKAFLNYRETNMAGVEKLLLAESSIKKGFEKLFKAAIDETINDAKRKGCFVVNITAELIPGDDEIYKILQANKKALEGFFADYVQKGIDTGEIDSSKNVKSLASFLYTLYSGFRIVAKVDANPLKLQEMVNVGLSVLD